MRGIISIKRDDGTYHEVGMTGRTITGSYKTERNLIKFGVPQSWKESGVRIELFHDDNIYCEPFRVIYV